MNLKDLVSLIDGRVLLGDHRLEESVEYAVTSDLMSDVLTISTCNDNFLLITGLANVQAIRTVEMLDVQYIIFARGKEITEDMVELARDNDLVLISSDYSTFRVSGILYGAGIKPIY